jgi:hypothetical protein
MRTEKRMNLNDVPPYHIIGAKSQPVVVLSDDTVDVSLPRVINLNQDPLFSECLVYYIPEGVVTAGSKEADADILLSGPDINGRHCMITHGPDGLVSLKAVEGALVFVNGDLISSSSSSSSGNKVGIALRHCDRIAFGRFHLFRFEAGGQSGRWRSNKNGGNPNGLSASNGGIRNSKEVGGSIMRNSVDNLRNSTESPRGSDGTKLFVTWEDQRKKASEENNQNGNDSLPPDWEFAQEELMRKNDSTIGRGRRPETRLGFSERDSEMDANRIDPSSNTIQNTPSIIQQGVYMLRDTLDTSLIGNSVKSLTDNNINNDNSLSINASDQNTTQNKTQYPTYPLETDTYYTNPNSNPTKLLQKQSLSNLRTTTASSSSRIMLARPKPDQIHSSSNGSSYNNSITDSNTIITTDSELKKNFDQNGKNLYTDTFSSSEDTVLYGSAKHLPPPPPPPPTDTIDQSLDKDGNDFGGYLSTMRKATQREWEKVSIRDKEIVDNMSNFIGSESSKASQPVLTSSSSPLQANKTPRIRPYRYEDSDIGSETENISSMEMNQQSTYTNGIHGNGISIKGTNANADSSSSSNHTYADDRGYHYNGPDYTRNIDNNNPNNKFLHTDTAPIQRNQVALNAKNMPSNGSENDKLFNSKSNGGSAPAVSFESEAMALQEELSQMQKALQDRMQRYQVLTSFNPNKN